MRAEIAILGLFFLGYAAGYDGVANQLPSAIGEPLQQLHDEVNKIGTGDLSTLTGKDREYRAPSSGGGSGWWTAHFETNAPAPPPPPAKPAKPAPPQTQSGPSLFNLPPSSKVSGLFDRKPSTIPSAAERTVVPVCQQDGSSSVVGGAGKAVSPQAADAMTGKVLKVLCLRPVVALRRGADRLPLSDGQRAALDAWAETRGYLVVSLYTVGDAADDPELEALLDEAGAGLFNAVLPIDQDGGNTPQGRSGTRDPVLQRLREAGLEILHAGRGPLSASAGGSAAGVPAEPGRI